MRAGHHSIRLVQWIIMYFIAAAEQSKAMQTYIQTYAFHAHRSQETRFTRSLDHADAYKCIIWLKHNEKPTPQQKRAIFKDRENKTKKKAHTQEYTFVIYINILYKRIYTEIFMCATGYALLLSCIFS